MFLSGCRDLLGQAVKGAQAPDQIGAVDPDDPPIRKAGSQDLGGERIVGVIETREEHDPIGDIEIGIAGRQTLSLIVERCGHGQRDHAQGRAVWQPHGTQALQIFLQGLKILIIRIMLNHRDHGVLTHKTRYIIDMSIGVVTRNPMTQPKDLLYPEQIA